MTSVWENAYYKVYLYILPSRLSLRVHAEIPATTDSGKKVILHEDGTWEYVENNKVDPASLMFGL